MSRNLLVGGPRKFCGNGIFLGIEELKFHQASRRSLSKRIIVLPVYHVDIAAVAASADHKWVDNLLARFQLPGVERARRGVARRISVVGLRHIVLIRWLSRELGLPIGRAVHLARRALSSVDGVVEANHGVELRVDLALLAADIESVLAEAVESIVPARRGRPPRTAGEVA
jgi:hypothetical protein